jgi:hypothetical protein
VVETVVQAAVTSAAMQMPAPSAGFAADTIRPSRSVSFVPTLMPFSPVQPIRRW